MNELIPYQYYVWIAYGWAGIGIITFFYLFRQTAPYGRHTSENWGPMINNKIGWFIMEFTVLVVLYAYFTNIEFQLGLIKWFMVGLFTFHYLNRSIIFPFRIRTKGKMMPAVIALMAIFFNLMNGSLLGLHFTYFSDYTISWWTDPRFIIGCIIFTTGMVINWKADGMLIQLRKPGESGYKIPNGWLFEYISCPNLFGEILEWFGFAILTWSLSGAVFFIWTFANLVPRAIAHHRWYKNHFNDYPAKRKAIFPGLW